MTTTRSTRTDTLLPEPTLCRSERIESSLLRLMGTIAIVTIRKGGKSYKRRVQLLGSSDESLEKDGFPHYRIPEELIEILRNSEVYARLKTQVRSEEHTSELKSLMRISYAVFGLKKKHNKH